jgi:hypothetical protein
MFQGQKRADLAERMRSYTVFVLIVRPQPRGSLISVL